MRPDFVYIGSIIKIMTEKKAPVDTSFVFIKLSSIESAADLTAHHDILPPFALWFVVTSPNVNFLVF